MATRDYFAELYVAGLMGDAGWAIYFPKRDVGFDFVATKQVDEHVLIRPVQVKGLYPSKRKLDKIRYGYVGKLSQLHTEMVLVLPFFPIDVAGVAPDTIAWMPRHRIRTQTSKGYAYQPASFKDGHAKSRREYARYFDAAGLAAVSDASWGLA